MSFRQQLVDEFFNSKLGYRDDTAEVSELNSSTRRKKDSLTIPELDYGLRIFGIPLMLENYNLKVQFLIWDSMISTLVTLPHRFLWYLWLKIRGMKLSVQ